MKLGIFGGTFDPIHIGHLIVVDDVAADLGLDRILFIPAGTHPLKRSAVEAPAELRLRMIREATAGSGLFVADDRELKRPGPSYTIDTLEQLQSENPEAELFLLVGADILGELHEWHRAAEIAARARITVMTRGRLDPVPRAEVEVAYDVHEVTLVGISSTEIRRRIRDGEPYRYLVPEPVRRIIEEHSLYKARD